MKTGIELISKEREEQIEKHGYTVEKDKVYYSSEFNRTSELMQAVEILINPTISQSKKDNRRPFAWDRGMWHKLVNKPFKDRLVISGALIAAELDRLNYGN